jgi:hypothetical protein
MEGPYLWQKPTSFVDGPQAYDLAAELHAYKGKYYYFATFTNRAVKIDTVDGNVIETQGQSCVGKR